MKIKRIVLIVFIAATGCAANRGPPCYTKEYITAAVWLGFFGGYERGYKQAEMDFRVGDFNDVGINQNMAGP